MESPILQILSIILRTVIAQDEKDTEGTCIAVLYKILEETA